MAITGQQFADRWGRNMKNASQSIREGVNAVTVAPGVKAASKANKMLAGIQRAIADGTWQKAVAAVSLQDWQKAMLDKGVGRINAGVDAAQAHMAVMGDKLLAALGSVAATVDKMPDDTLEDRIARAVKQMELMSKVKLR